MPDDYREAVARAIHAVWCPLLPSGPCDTDWAAADAVLAVPHPEVERLRRRIHEAVDETQRRYAKYQKRCSDFDRRSAWARELYEKHGLNRWLYCSHAEWLLVMSFIEDAERAIAERDAARAELSQLQAAGVTPPDETQLTDEEQREFHAAASGVECEFES